MPSHRTALPTVLEAALAAANLGARTVLQRGGSGHGGSAGGVRGPLRTAAIELGDGIANSQCETYPGPALRFTEAYLALWPTLPNTPAEHTAPYASHAVARSTTFNRLRI